MARGHRPNPCSVLVAELLAVWYGLSAAVRLYRNQMLFVQGDSLTAIRWIQNQSSVNVIDIPYYKDILAIVNLFPACTFNHIYRE